jgi:GNAT superfamily N-acetyltransferase
MVEIVEAGLPDIPVIAQIAENTWPHAYGSILSPEQLRYMLDAIYSQTILTEVMTEGSQKFLLLKDKDGYQGFASFGPRREDAVVYKLHKLYVLPTCQGKGYGKLLIDEVKKQVEARGSNTLDLNVNRFNPAREFYQKLGFKIIREEDVPIGPFWMNDYVMRCQLR